MPTADKAITFTVSPSGGGSLTDLGISGDMFTINGVETFLLGVSYFQALNWRTSDIDALQQRGFNWIRIWLEHWNTDQLYPPAAQLASLQSNGSFTGSASILSLIDYCDARGIVVEIVVFDWESNPVSSNPLAAIANVTAALGGKKNIFYDALNEHNLGTGIANHTTLQQWITAIRAGDPDALVTTSTSRGHVGADFGDGIIPADINADVATGLNFLAPHFNRESGWDTGTATRVTATKNHLVSIGANIPVMLTEENRRGLSGQQPVLANFSTALLGAFNSGAAGWLFHNDDCFYLTALPMFSQFDSEDLLVANSLAAVIAPADDWAARWQAPGVTQHSRLDTQAIIDDWKFAQTDHIFLDTTIKPPGAAGSLKFAILNTDGSPSGQLDVPLNATFGNGSTVWFSYRVYLQAAEVYQPWPYIGGLEGPKYSILSRDSNGVPPTGSNQVNEYVIQQNFNTGHVLSYYQDGSSYPPLQVFEANVCNTTDFRSMMALNLGASPLTGFNIDTGAAWTACEQYRAARGSLYSVRGSGGTSSYRRGLGDPISGGRKFTKPGQWITFTGRVIIGNFGSANNRLTFWAAPANQPYTKLWDEPGILLGGGYDYTGLVLLPYMTNRQPGGRRVSSRTNAITGATIHAVGVATPLGVGTLEYNATTQRFRWRGASESFGTARGFSAANDILFINVIASGAFDSFVVVEVNPTLLPTAGIPTDSVTIADGRADTQRNVADVIISTQPINAPGGYAPP